MRRPGQQIFIRHDISDQAFAEQKNLIFDEPSFIIFLIGKLGAISPLYEERAVDFCKLEAGIISHLLETSAPQHDIGLYQVGGFDFEQVRHLFALADDHLYLHCLFGGRINPRQKEFEGLLEESRESLAFVELIRTHLEKKAQDQRESPAITVSQPQLHDHATLSEELRHFLAERLPDYMMPSRFMFLEELPVTSNGKVDRQALLSLGLSLEEQTGQTKYEEPSSEMERKLAAVVQEVLGVEKVSIHYNFFELGATSIDIIVIHNKLKEVYNYEFDIVLLFERPTISSLAKGLTGEDAEEDPTRGTRDQARAHKTARQRRRQLREDLESQ